MRICVDHQMYSFPEGTSLYEIAKQAEGSYPWPIILAVEGGRLTELSKPAHGGEEISFVTDSIALVLQLALAIDYAIILCHRFTEEQADKQAREAAIAALSKAIPEIAGSSLTTISGLLALTFMQYKLGADMGFVLIKAVLISLLSVFYARDTENGPDVIKQIRWSITGK